MSRRGELALTLEALAAAVDARLDGDPALRITGLNGLEEAGPGDLSHFSSPRYRDALRRSMAGAVILRAEHCPLWHGAALIVEDPYLSYARVSWRFRQQIPAQPGVHASAQVEPGAELAPDVALAAGAVIAAGAVLEAGVRIGPNVVVGADCRIGSGTVLHGGVVLYDDVELGSGCEVHAGAVIGADGFGYATDAEGRLQPIAQLGGVRIGAQVHIGAGTTIDRGALAHTCIEDGVKIDNQVQVGHNCRIGAHSVLCGNVGLAGSTRIGRHCRLGGGVGVAGDGPVTLCDWVTVAATTHVAASIDQPGYYAGGVLHAAAGPARRNALRFGRLDELFRRVARLERRRQDGDP